MLQKEEKRIHSVKYNVVKDYNGSFFALKHGFKALCCFPWTEDPRLVLNSNETVSVTRWQRHWLYGEIKIDESAQLNKKRRHSKGWFPSNCVKQIKNLAQNENDSDKKDN